MWTSGLYQATESGHFVSADHQRIAQIIADYDPNLRLAYIPECDRDPSNPNEKPFVVIDVGNGEREPHAVFFADECDERLLARVFANDTHKVDVWSRIQSEEAARKAIEYQKEMERIEFGADVARTLKRRSFS